MSRLVNVPLAGLAWLLLAGPVMADDAPPPQAAPPAPAAAAAAPAPAPAPPPKAAPGRGIKGVAKEPAKNDRVDLDPTSIRGTQELPKVLYIVPWKDSGPGEPAGRPVNSLIDEALAPVDREVFRRQVGYFDQLYPASGRKPGAGGASP